MNIDSDQAKTHHLIVEEHHPVPYLMLELSSTEQESEIQVLVMCSNGDFHTKFQIKSHKTLFNTRWCVVCGVFA